MKRLVLVLAATALVTAPLVAAPLVGSDLPEFTGQIEPQLALDTQKKMPLKLMALTAEERAALPAPLAAGDKAFGGSISFPVPKPVRVVLVEPEKGPGKGEPFLYVDRDQDGKLVAEERFLLPPAPPAGEKSEARKGAAVSLPLAKGRFTSYPLEIFDDPDAERSMPAAMKGKADKILMAALFTYIEGRVTVDGKPVLVRYFATPTLEEVKPQSGEIEMDVDGDGTIDSRPGSLETDIAKDAAAIFRIGERYVSLKSIDLATGRMVVQSHPPSDYLRLDLRAGSTVPDFSFVDLEGKSHKLSDWRGRYLLLDFWATWCIPCIAEFPNLKQAYQEYHPRGFDIVGVLYKEEDEKARKYLADPANGLPWLQATAASTSEMSHKRFRIQSIPTTLLLGPDGRIVSAGRKGEPPLDGKELLETLAALLPAQGGETAASP